MIRRSAALLWNVNCSYDRRKYYFFRRWFRAVQCWIAGRAHVVSLIDVEMSTRKEENEQQLIGANRHLSSRGTAQKTRSSSLADADKRSSAGQKEGYSKADHASHFLKTVQSATTNYLKLRLVYSRAGWGRPRPGPEQDKQQKREKVTEIRQADRYRQTDRIVMTENNKQKGLKWKVAKKNFKKWKRAKKTGGRIHPFEGTSEFRIKHW